MVQLVKYQQYPPTERMAHAAVLYLKYIGRNSELSKQERITYLSQSLKLQEAIFGPRCTVDPPQGRTVDQAFFRPYRPSLTHFIFSVYFLYSFIWHVAF